MPAGGGQGGFFEQAMDKQADGHGGEVIDFEIGRHRLKVWVAVLEPVQAGDGEGNLFVS